MRVFFTKFLTRVHAQPVSNDKNREQQQQQHALQDRLIPIKEISQTTKTLSALHN